MNTMPTEPKTQADPHKLREDALEKFFATSLGTGGRHEAFRAGFDTCMAIMAEAAINLTKMREDLERRTPTPAVGDRDDKAILDFVERNFRIFHISGPDMSGKDWVVRIPPTETAPAKRERHLTLRDAALSAIHATGGPGK